MVTSLSKIAGLNKDSQLLSSIPLKETHGAFFAVSSLMKVAKLMTELGFPLNSIHLGIDALSQVTALLTPPAHFTGQLQKYYSSINVHLYELAQITNLFKEDQW